MARSKARVTTYHELVFGYPPTYPLEGLEFGFVDGDDHEKDKILSDFFWGIILDTVDLPKPSEEPLKTEVPGQLSLMLEDSVCEVATAEATQSRQQLPPADQAK